MQLPRRSEFFNATTQGYVINAELTRNLFQRVANQLKLQGRVETPGAEAPGGSERDKGTAALVDRTIDDRPEANVETVAKAVRTSRV